MPKTLTASLALAAFLVAGAALAQPAPAQPDAATKPNGQGAVGEPLQSGANSFTEAQVRERFGKMGFGEVRDLSKDDQGIWHGTATHAGREVRIGMDYRGNVAAQ